ncbi:hypothetical protein EGW08_016414 [Elysia chlorotica]|uniref:Uncharacterized protein n=1 Tax=Elysia chlorotica TaxID=188477 RepID=A0A433T2P9_ELYCH|nr:hypothetical protein EGW08_016414 [Elysia chlorotica]
MSSFPYHTPVCWKLFRNEPLESQCRRAAITKCHAAARRDSKKNPLWWDAQKYVDQVVPAEFISPCEIDTSTYRYQVFARPPPIKCPPRSLREVTDAEPPIRYNVKRVAVDKPFPTPSFECGGHWAKHQFVLRRKEDNGAALGQDSSGNNNARSAISMGSNVSQNRSTVHQNKNYITGQGTPLEANPANTHVLGGTKEPNGGVPVQAGAQFGMERQCERKTAPCWNENNSKTCPRLNSKPNSFNISKRHILGEDQGLQSDQADRKSETQDINRLAQEAIHVPKLSTIQPRVSPSREPNVERGFNHYTFPQDGQSQKEQIDRTPTQSARKSHSNLSNFLTGPIRSTDRCGNNRFKSSTNLSGCSISPSASRISCQSGLKDALQPLVRHNASTLSSRTCSPCSVSTISMCPSPRQACATNRSGFGNRGSVLRRDSVASLISDGQPSPLLIPGMGDGRRKFSVSKTVSCQESVASLLSESNHSNNNINEHSAVMLSFGAMQDLFTELFVPKLTQNRSFYNVSDSEDLCENTWSSNSEFLEIGNVGRVANPLCTNNNASTSSDKYILQCCPAKIASEQSQAYYGPEKRMVCRFHEYQPQILQEPLALDQVVPIDPLNGKVTGTEDPKELQCTMMMDCRTGRPYESEAGPLFLCEPKQQVKPKIGYGTYKIVGDLQRRQKPFPNFFKNLNFPPDIAEYKEFITRCPNYSMGRYDRTNPLNEPLLPSNKSSNLLVGSLRGGPYNFCKMPKQKLPALFQPLKTRSDLNWSLPSSPFIQ